MLGCPSRGEGSGVGGAEVDAVDAADEPTDLQSSHANSKKNFEKNALSAMD